MRPMISAASARTRKSRESAEPIGSPIIPARRNSARKASMPAIAHTIVCRFFTGTPSRLARSARSAAARMATPTDVRCRKSPMPRMAIGAITSTRRSLALNTSGSTRKVKSNGGSMRCDRTFSPNTRGRNRPPNASSWVSPSVATVSTSRGARKKRRMINSSQAAPSATATANPAPNATNHGRPEVITIITESEAGMYPRSAWAKLRIRLARYTSAMPTLTIAVSNPMSTPRSATPAGMGNATIWNSRIRAAGATVRPTRRARSSQRATPQRSQSAPRHPFGRPPYVRRNLAAAPWRVAPRALDPKVKSSQARHIERARRLGSPAVAAPGGEGERRRGPINVRAS